MTPSPYPHISAAYTPKADDIVDSFQELCQSIDELTEHEQARLLTAMIQQLSGKLSKVIK